MSNRGENCPWLGDGSWESNPSGWPTFLAHPASILPSHRGRRPHVFKPLNDTTVYGGHREKTAFLAKNGEKKKKKLLLLMIFKSNISYAEKIKNRGHIQGSQEISPLPCPKLPLPG